MKKTKTNLNSTEFRFLLEALRGGLFDYYGCGCRRRHLLIEEVITAIDDADDDELPDVDLERLIPKIEAMTGADTRELIERIN